MIFKLKTNEICKLIDVDLTNLGEGGGKCSKSFTKYGGVKELESLMVSELNAYVVNFPPHGLASSHNRKLSFSASANLMA
ncbi:hypothetical protein YC2023_115734 [Brassica napus]